METVFSISNCYVENQIKFSTCTLLACDLTWWNSHVRTVGHDVAYAMTWAELKKKMTDKYYPRGEMKKLKVELWNLKVKGTDVIGYNQHFQELALLCVRMFPEESDKIERYVGGLLDMIHGSVVVSKPKTMQDAIEMATELMDKKIRTFAERQIGNKSKMITNNNNNTNKTRGRTLVEPTLQDLVKRNLTEDLNLCVLNATITTTVRCSQIPQVVKVLAIWHVTVGGPANVITVTITGVWAVRNLLAMNVEPRDISRGIVQS
ncbi:reverse transcriptase domain-containing protein [Tanacetum coccineum]